MKIPRIIQLDPLLANQIAAGEVIERPASVVKELLENSIDARATRIDVEIEGAGIHLIRVRDNGVGIAKSDLGLAFSRHATSKISTTDDLTKIVTLGFRGEALASIASVSRCRLISQSQQDPNAAEIQIAPDLSVHEQPAAHPIGTTIEVADLFYNTPVRRKFLRSDKTEFQLIDEIVKRLAMSHPQVSFRLKHQQRQLRYYPATSAITSDSSRLAKICGQQFIDKAIQIDAQIEGLQVMGYLGLPDIGHRQGDLQYFFVNQRMVKDRIINHAIKTIYQQQANFIEGSYPCYVLFLTLPPQEVDVNVHPTKQEVRFQQARLVHDFMTKCVDNALMQAKKIHTSSQQSTKQQTQPLPVSRTPLEQIDTSVLGSTKTLFPRKLRYFLIEQEDGVTIVDLFQAKKALLSLYFTEHAGNIPQKTCLFPIAIPEMFSLTDDPKFINQMFMRFGFTVRIHAQNSLLLQKPEMLSEKDDKHLPQLLINMVSQRSEEKIRDFLADQLSAETLWKIPYPVLESLIIQYLSNSPKVGYLRLSHAEIVPT